MKKHLSLIIKIVVSLGLLSWLLNSVRWQEIFSLIVSINLAWLTLAIGLIVLSIAVSVTKWQAVIRAQGLALTWSELWKAYWAGLFFNNFLPSSIGGDALRIWWVGDITGDLAGATASVVVERVLATVGLALLGLLGAGWMGTPDPRVAGIFGGLLAVSILLMLIILGLPRPERWSVRTGRLASFVRAWAGHGQRLRGQRRVLLKVVLWSVLFQALVVAVNYAIFQAMGLPVSFRLALYLVPATSAAAMIPLGINGYGLREGAYVTLLGAYGISSSGAFASSILFAFLVSLCSLYGALTWLTNRKRRDAVDEGFTDNPLSPTTHEEREQLLPGGLAGSE